MTFVAQLNDHGHVWLTHVIPAVLVVAVALVTRSVNVRSAREVGVAAAAVVRSAPLLAPLVLVVLVLPALSADLWQAAADIDASDVGVLVVVTVLPVLLFVMRQLVSELPAVLESRALALAADPERDDLTRALLRERLSPQAFETIDFAAAGHMASAWPANPPEYAPLIAAAEEDALRWPLRARLALCVVVVAAALTAYLYVVLATMIDPAVARAWSHEDVPIGHLHAAGITLWLPGGIYFRLVGLLGVLATATFLAFSLLEGRFSTALGDVLLRLPADRLLALALPYLALREERLAAGGSDALDDWGPGSLMAEEPSATAPAN
ncbi:MAG: hypothetical protein ACXVHB_32710 [Solirubrobacteraceae bacterium]